MHVVICGMSELAPPSASYPRGGGLINGAFKSVLLLLCASLTQRRPAHHAHVCLPVSKVEAKAMLGNARNESPGASLSIRWGLAWRSENAWTSTTSSGAQSSKQVQFLLEADKMPRRLR